MRAGLRFLRLEASSPALRDTEAYFPMKDSAWIEARDRSAIDLRSGWGGDG